MALTKAQIERWAEEEREVRTKAARGRALQSGGQQWAHDVATVLPGTRVA